MAETSVFGGDDIFLGCLPLFHSFGLTVGLWHPFTAGVPVVTVPSPLEAGKVGDAVGEERVTVVTTTPTFLRSYLRKWKPEQAGSIRLLMTGAERLPDDLAAGVWDSWKVAVQQGYGLTETTPVAAINQPDPNPEQGSGLGAQTLQTGAKAGSIGRLLPGMAYRLTDPETGEPATERGVLLLRGANVFGGYLDRPDENNKAFRDGWFITGDVVRIDAQNFLTIEGRLSRFSKIGGEMVPHGTVEESVANAFPSDNGAVAHVVLGVPDEAKGEQLVLLTTMEIDVAALKERLTAAGLAALWVPRTVRRVDVIPVLASGKVDLAGCKKILK